VLVEVLNQNNIKDDTIKENQHVTVKKVLALEPVHNYSYMTVKKESTPNGQKTSNTRMT